MVLGKLASLGIFSRYSKERLEQIPVQQAEKRRGHWFKRGHENDIQELERISVFADRERGAAYQGAAQKIANCKILLC